MNNNAQQMIYNLQLYTVNYNCKHNKRSKVNCSKIVANIKLFNEELQLILKAKYLKLKIIYKWIKNCIT